MLEAKWLASFCLLLTYVISASAINCYQCKSNEDIYCAEKFDEVYSTLLAESCDNIFEARYCIKTTGMYGGEIGTRRFCSARDHGNYCEYIKRPGDEYEYRSCVYTCRSDGCNGVESNLLVAKWLLLLPLLTIHSAYYLHLPRL